MELKEQQIKRFEYYLERMRRLMRKKGHDYGKVDDSFANLRECKRLGLKSWEGVELRVMDKNFRIQQSFESGEWDMTKDKPLDDLIDRAIYSIIQIILLEEEQNVIPADYTAAEAGRVLGEAMRSGGVSINGKDKAAISST